MCTCVSTSVAHRMFFGGEAGAARGLQWGGGRRPAAQPAEHAPLPRARPQAFSEPRRPRPRTARLRVQPEPPRPGGGVGGYQHPSSSCVCAFTLTCVCARMCLHACMHACIGWATHPTVDRLAFSSHKLNAHACSKVQSPQSLSPFAPD